MSSQQVQQIIDSLNHAAGTGWEALLRQQYVVAGQEFATAFVLLVIVVAAYKVSRHLWRKSRDDSYNEMEWGSGAVLAGLVAIGLLIALPFIVLDAAAHLINPAAYAIQSLPGFHQ